MPKLKRVPSGKRRNTRGKDELRGMVDDANDPALSPQSADVPTPMPDKAELDSMYLQLLEELAIPEAKRDAMISKEPDDRKWKLIQQHSAMLRLTKSDNTKAHMTPQYWVNVIQGRNVMNEPSMTVAQASELQVVIRTSHKRFLKEFIQLHGVHLLVDLARWYTGRQPRTAEEKEILPKIMTCFKALMNNQMGMDAVLGIEDSVTAIALAMDLNDVSDIRTTQEVVMLLAVTCFYSSLGRNLVVKAMDDVRLRYREAARFETLVNLFEECNDNEFRAAVIMFITTIVNSAASVESRVRVRNDFLALDIMRIFEHAVAEANDDDQACTVIATQFQVYEDMLVADHAEVVHSMFKDDNESIASFVSDENALDLSDMTQVFEVVRSNALRSGCPELALELLQKLLLIPAERTLAVPTWTAIIKFVGEATSFDTGHHRARAIKINYSLLHDLLDKRMSLENNVSQLSSSDEIINKQRAKIRELESKLEVGGSSKGKSGKGKSGKGNVADNGLAATSTETGGDTGEEVQILKENIAEQEKEIDFLKKKVHELKKKNKKLKTSGAGGAAASGDKGGNDTGSKPGADDNDNDNDNDNDSVTDTLKPDSTGLAPAGCAPGKKANIPPVPAAGMPGSLDQAPVKVTPALLQKLQEIQKANGHGSGASASASSSSRAGRKSKKNAKDAPAAAPGGLSALQNMLGKRAATMPAMKSGASALSSAADIKAMAASAAQKKSQAALLAKFPEKKPIYPNVKMRSVFWTKIQPNQLEGTIWSKLSDNKIKIEPKQLEAQFGKALLGEGSGKKTLSRMNTMERKAKQEVHLCDSKRQQNLGIALSRFRISDKELRVAILQMEETLLTLDRARALVILAPTPEEIELINNFEESNGDVNKLCREDKFLREMVRVPRMQQRMKCIVTKLTFEQDIASIWSRTQSIIAACKEVENSKELHRLLEIVLAVGNYANGGTPRGGAYGFKLDVLTKLEAVKGNGGKHTLLHFLVQLLELHYPSLLNLKLPKSEEAAEVSLSDIQQEINAVATGMREIKHELEEEHDPKHDRFVKVMSGFEVRASKKVADVRAEFEKVRQEFQRVALLFAEKGPKVEPSSVFDRFVRFHKAIMRCKEQIDQQRLRAKRQQKLEEEKKARIALKKQRSLRLQSTGGSEGGNGGVFEAFAKANAGNASDIVENFLQRYRKSSYANLQQQQGIRDSAVAGVRDSRGEDGADGAGGEGGEEELMAILARRKAKDKSRRKKKSNKNRKKADMAVA